MKGVKSHTFFIFTSRTVLPALRYFDYVFTSDDQIFMPAGTTFKSLFIQKDINLHIDKTAAKPIIFQT